MYPRNFPADRAASGMVNFVLILLCLNLKRIIPRGQQGEICHEGCSRQNKMQVLLTLPGNVVVGNWQLQRMAPILLTEL
jgi:hypothetical protein